MEESHLGSSFTFFPCAGREKHSGRGGHEGHSNSSKTPPTREFENIVIGGCKISRSCKSSCLSKGDLVFDLKVIEKEFDLHLYS